MAILKQEPVKAFMYQDHEAHIQVHMAAMQDPKIQQMVGQSPFASAIQSAMSSHITEHVAYQYRKEIQLQLGVEMPSEDQALPEDTEEEISRLAAQAAQKLLGKNQSEIAQQQAEEAAKDPLTIIQQREIAIKEQELKHKIEMDRASLDLDATTKIGNLDLQAERIKSENKRAGASIGARIATELDKEQRKDKREGAKLGLEIAKELDKSSE
jgi:hypothetical protein